MVPPTSPVVGHMRVLADAIQAPLNARGSREITTSRMRIGQHQVVIHFVRHTFVRADEVGDSHIDSGLDGDFAPGIDCRTSLQQLRAEHDLVFARDHCFATYERSQDTGELLTCSRHNLHHDFSHRAFTITFHVEVITSINPQNQSLQHSVNYVIDRLIKEGPLHQAETTQNQAGHIPKRPRFT